MLPINGLDSVCFFEPLNFSLVGVSSLKVSFWQGLGLFCLGEGGDGESADCCRWVDCGYGFEEDCFLVFIVFDDG